MRSEFEFIRNLKSRFGLNRVGDDCAILPKNSRTDLLITTDLLVEDIDFRLDWGEPEAVGHKALAVSLSDIAAMGGAPTQALVSLGLPRRVWRGSFADAFYEGWTKLAATYDVELVGGDVSRTPNRIVIDSIVIGEVKRRMAVPRSGATPGDSIFVTGQIGGAAGGLKILESRSATRLTKPETRLVERQLRPAPRVHSGIELGSERIATSMIDISDGFAADLYHLCDASSVGARIELSRLPIDADLEIFGDEKFELATGGGEDFELLFTSHRKKLSKVARVPVTRVGEITDDTGNIELLKQGAWTRLPRAGFRHF